MLIHRIAAALLFCAAGAAAQENLKANLDLPVSVEAQDGEDADGPLNIITFYGQQYEGDGVFYCLDRSGSMEDHGEMDILRREVSRNIQEFSEKVQFSLIFFGSDTVAFPDAAKPVDATPGMKLAACNFLKAINPSGATCAGRALMQALRSANASTANRSIILFLTDGYLFCPGTDEGYAEGVLKDLTGNNYRRIPLHVVGIGADIDAEYLRRLAAQNNGTFRQISR